jgi:predicted outer membrane lipoprotein
MKRVLCISIPILFFACVLGVSLAAAQTASPPPSWFEHVDLMQITICGLGLVVMFFIVRTLKKIDGNQNRLFERLDDLTNQVNIMQGEHNAMMGRCRASAGKNRRHTDERPD